MIGLRLQNDPGAEITALIARFAELPRHIAKKHLQAAMKRAIKPGVPIVRALTPPAGTRRGRRKKGDPRSTGALRRAVISKSKYTGKSSSGYVTGVVGYKYGLESRKALWLDQGTAKIQPRRFMDQFTAQYSGPVLETLKTEMVVGLEKAAKELASGKNPGR